MVYRYMEQRDLDAVCALEEMTFARPWSRDSLTKAFANTDNVYTVCAGDDGSIIAYCGIWGIGTEGEICNVAVHQDARGQGIGSALLQFSIEQCMQKGRCCFSLEVRKSNAPAIHLYEKYGFVVEGVRPGYYTLPTEDALIMWKRQGFSDT